MGKTTSKQAPAGFTLIELSIVLVIIGLITGGVLVGQDLRRAAAVRAQVSQIEKYNTAVNAFRDKYGGLPGDISASLVTQFGFPIAPARAGTAGQGDGNGLIESYYFGSSMVRNGLINGETAWFWEDLASNARLMEGSFFKATATGLPPIANPPNTIIPEAKIGGGNFVYVYMSMSNNYFGVSVISIIDPNGAMYGSAGSTAGSDPGITVQQAYMIDKKLDDGLPQSGNVTALYENWPLTTAANNYGPVWASGGGVVGAVPGTATIASPLTCYDNGGNSSAPMQYSVQQSGGSGVNCALSFRMQAGTDGPVMRPVSPSRLANCKETPRPSAHGLQQHKWPPCRS